MPMAPAAKKREMEDREWRRREMERIERMEEWIAELETESEGVF